MAVSNTETIGFGDQMIELLQGNSTRLKANGLEVANWVTEITDQKNTAVSEGNKQDEMQAAAKAQTQVSEAAHKTLYDNLSTKLDAVVGVLGKNSPEAKQMAKLRSSINKQYNKKKSDIPKPE